MPTLSKSVSLSFLEPSGPVVACIGISLPFVEGFKFASCLEMCRMDKRARFIKQDYNFLRDNNPRGPITDDGNTRNAHFDSTHSRHTSCLKSVNIHEIWLSESYIPLRVKRTSTSALSSIGIINLHFGRKEKNFNRVKFDKEQSWYLRSLIKGSVFDISRIELRVQIPLWNAIIWVLSVSSWVGCWSAGPTPQSFQILILMNIRSKISMIKFFFLHLYFFKKWLCLLHILFP